MTEVNRSKPILRTGQSGAILVSINTSHISVLQKQYVSAKGLWFSSQNHVLSYQAHIRRLLRSSDIVVRVSPANSGFGVTYKKGLWC